MVSQRPFKVLGVQQIAIGGPSKDRLLSLWVDLLGLNVVSEFKSERENVDETILSLGEGIAEIEFDLMQPLDANAKPKVDTPPLNHIGLWIDDLHAAVAYLESKGVRFAPGGIRKGASGHDICFIHPRGNEQHPHSGEGVLLELVQAPKSLIDQLLANK